MFFFLWLLSFLQVVGKNAASFLICQVFHSQSLYWSVMLISIMNLEVIAIERFCAIVFPFKHAKVTRGDMHKVIGAMYPISPIAIIFAFVQVSNPYYLLLICNIHSQ